MNALGSDYRYIPPYLVDSSIVRLSLCLRLGTFRLRPTSHPPTSSSIIPIYHLLSSSKTNSNCKQAKKAQVSLYTTTSPPTSLHLRKLELSAPHFPQLSTANPLQVQAASMAEGKYANDPEWASIKPIQLDDGSDSGAMPLASIAYPSEYLEATSYLRAVMAANEMSERALRLTEDVISLNPAHYTVWYVQDSLAIRISESFSFVQFFD